MNCLEVCKQIATEPNHLSAQVVLHLKTCDACQRYAAAQQNFEQQLEQAIQIDPPKHLVAQILLQQTNLRQKKRSGWKTKLTAIAASLMIAVSVLFGLRYWLPVTLEQSVLAHIYNELDHLHEKKAINLNQLNQMASQYQIQFKQTPAKLNYAGTCRIHKHKGLHLVVEGQHGPVTILLMPNEIITVKEQIKDSRFYGRITPIANGSMAIIGNRAEDLNQLEQQIRTALKTKI